MSPLELIFVAILTSCHVDLNAQSLTPVEEKCVDQMVTCVVDIDDKLEGDAALAAMAERVELCKKK